jgi:hypothetical protein
MHFKLQTNLSGQKEMDFVDMNGESGSGMGRGLMSWGVFHNFELDQRTKARHIIRGFRQHIVVNNFVWNDLIGSAFMHSILLVSNSSLPWWFILPKLKMRNVQIKSRYEWPRESAKFEEHDFSAASFNEKRFNVNNKLIFYLKYLWNIKLSVDINAKCECEYVQIQIRFI